jgi:type IV pilus assembly protein PilC
MQTFRYSAVGADGHRVRGVSAALSEADLEGRLARIGLHLLKARPQSARLPRLGRRAVDSRARLDLLMQLESLLRAGVPLVEALGDLSSSAPTRPLADLVSMLRDRIESGATLSQAMADHAEVFDEQIVGLVQAAEATGELPAVLARIVASLKWRDELATKVRKALSYPAFVAVVVSAAVVFLMIYLVPQLVLFLQTMGQKLPLATRALIAVSDAFVRFWYLIFGLPLAAAAATWAAAKANPSVRRRLDALTLQLPILGTLVQKVGLARLAETLALLYRSGVPVLEALRRCESVVGNAILREAVARARALIDSGMGMADAFDTVGLLPPLVVRMLRIGERTGDLEGALGNVVYFYSRDVDATVERLQSMIEPVLTVVLGAVLGWVMFAVLGPVYEAIGRIRT